MNFTGKTIGFALTGSHCTHDEVLPQMSGCKIWSTASYPHSIADRC